MKNFSTQPYWQSQGGVDVPFRQNDYTKAADSIFPKISFKGMCFGICLENIRIIGTDKQKETKTFSPEQAVRRTIEKINQFTVSGDSLSHDKKRRSAIKMYTMQSYLQSYTLQVISSWTHKAVDVKLLTAELEKYGISFLILSNAKKNSMHAALLIKDDSVPTSYRIFDPNYGLSRSMNLDEVEGQLRSVVNYYYSEAGEIYINVSFTNPTPPLSEIKFLSKNRGCVKPIHIIQIMNGDIKAPSAKVNAERILNDLGWHFTRFLIFKYMYDPVFLNDNLEIQRLKEFGFNIQKDLKIYPIFYAALEKRWGDIKTLLEQYQQEGDTEFIPTLLAEDVYIGINIAHLAAIDSRWDVVDTILVSCEDNLELFGEFMKTQIHNGCNILYLAVVGGSVSTVNNILKIYQNNKSKLKSLTEFMTQEYSCLGLIAVNNGHWSVVDILIDKAKDDNELLEDLLESRGTNGDTLLHSAMREGSLSISKKILDICRSKPEALQRQFNIRNSFGMCAMDFALCGKGDEMLKMLLSYGASPSLNSFLNCSTSFRKQLVMLRHYADMMENTLYSFRSFGGSVVGEMIYIISEGLIDLVERNESQNQINNDYYRG